MQTLIINSLLTLFIMIVVASIAVIVVMFPGTSFVIAVFLAILAFVYDVQSN